MSSTEGFLWGANVILFILLLARGRISGNLYRYGPFYCYIGYSLISSLVRLGIALSFGMRSPYYFYTFHLGNLLIPLLQLWILWDIRGRLVGNSKKSWQRRMLQATLVVGMLLPVVWTVWRSGQEGPFIEYQSFFLRYHALTLFLQVLLCLVVYREVMARHELDLGRNLRGMLTGLSIMVALQAVNILGLLTQHVLFDHFRFFAQFIYFGSLAVFAYCMWDYEPVTETGPEEANLAEVNHNLRRAIRALLLPR